MTVLHVIVVSHVIPFPERNVAYQLPVANVPLMSALRPTNYSHSERRGVDQV